VVNTDETAFSDRLVFPLFQKIAKRCQWVVCDCLAVFPGGIGITGALAIQIAGVFIVMAVQA
jgi:prolipoprotein diacylglyceryltransferase